MSLSYVEFNIFPKYILIPQVFWLYHVLQILPPALVDFGVREMHLDAPRTPVKVTQSCPTLWDPMDYRLKAPLSMELSGPEYWSGWPFPSPGDHPNSGTEPGSVSCTKGRFFTIQASKEVPQNTNNCSKPLPTSQNDKKPVGLSHSPRSYCDCHSTETSKSFGKRKEKRFVGEGERCDEQGAVIVAEQRWWAQSNSHGWVWKSPGEMLVKQLGWVATVNLTSEARAPGNSILTSHEVAPEQLNPYHHRISRSWGRRQYGTICLSALWLRIF